ncbi:DUF692 family multinuclear iron-containing protein [Hymenobacter sp. BT730]|uniref:multinuclear nonheme iron-dependent oxidase n=1 Tax=Hymenobacter sp. BT730 TaxID=3063332 RepID=UPI0026DFF2BF|nr:DUF692 family multinuclear iron-containing protein [Hymenobacter sp. BT730]
MEEQPLILSAIAGNLDADILTAAFPLLEAGKIEAWEWSFDTLFQQEALPCWFEELLHTYSRQQRLIGHGVYFSLLSGRWTSEQQAWLERLRQLATQFTFDHITEHFGFFTGHHFHAGAPLPIPYNAATLRIGQDRLSRIYEAARCPVGLENLAFAYSLDQVKQHGEFLEKLVEPVNGFLILDLHNLYCQLHNFAVTYQDLIHLYPLDKVREIHISGGSWEDSTLLPGKKIRRDTHDGAVPEEVFTLLEQTIPQCPHLKYVVLEQLGSGLKTEASKARFRQDYRRMQRLVKQCRRNLTSHQASSFLPLNFTSPDLVVEDEVLAQEQGQLSHILETSLSFEEARTKLLGSSLAQSDWTIESWEPYMLETAVSIAQKWKQ